MTQVTRMEKWIAPRAIALLVVISVLIIGGGVLAYFIREGDLNRVERLERVVQCQHSPECRRFVERAIREILRHAKQSPSGKLEVSRDGKGTLRLIPRQGGITFVPESESQAPPPASQEPSAPDVSEPPKDNPKPEKKPKSSPAPIQSPPEGTEPQPESQPGPIPSAPDDPLPEKADEAAGDVLEFICTTIKELNGLC